VLPLERDDARVRRSDEAEGDERSEAANREAYGADYCTMNASFYPGPRFIMRTCVPMTSQGTPYGRFRKALDRRQTTAALSAAAELPHVGLADAAELLLLILENDPARYERAALRFHARYCAHTRADLGEASAILGLLAALNGERSAAAARALAELCERHDLLPLSKVLLRWAEGRGSSRGRN